MSNVPKVLPASSVPTPSKPLPMPSTLALVLKDPVTLQGDPDPTSWSPPDFTVLKDVLAEGLRAIDSQLVPAGPNGVSQALAALMLTTKRPNTNGLSREQTGAFLQEQLAEYQRLLQHIPKHVLAAAADAHVKRPSNFFPTVAELLEFAQPEYDKLLRFKARIERLMRGEAKPKPPPFVPEPYEVRMAAMIASYRKVGNHRRAAQLEIEFAKKQKREPEAWALTLIEQPAPVDEAERPPQPMPYRPPAPRSEADETRAFAHANEPPLPDEIPEE